MAMRDNVARWPMRMIPSVSGLTPASSDEILRPVHPGFIALTLFVALIANVVPSSPAVSLWRPDFLAIVLLYWCIHEPRYVGVGTAWFVGLAMDVADATMFGQHALAYAALAFAGDFFRRRVLRFPLWQQAVQVAALLAFTAVLVLLVRVVGGAPVPHWTYLMSPVLGALTWPPLSIVLQWPQRPTRARRDR